MGGLMISMTRTVLRRAGWLLILLIGIAAGRALEIKQVVWGFDGKPVGGRFNPVSILVSNPDNQPFDGTISLADEFGNRTSTEDTQSITLAPHTRRWVQFSFWSEGNSSNYSLLWEGGAPSGYTIASPRDSDAPARVRLLDGENVTAPQNSIPVLPERLFPKSVATTGGLDAVILDHAPAWEPAQQQAFLDWLHRGGTVHLLQTSGGAYPVFGAGLELLNLTVDETRFGAGRILRHEIPASEMSARYLAENGSPKRDLIQSGKPAIYDLENELLSTLSSITRPHISWPLIYLLVFAYIALIGPVHFFLRRKLDYRLSIALFLGAVLIFGLAIGFVGKRGYGESQIVHSLSLARSLGNGRYDVTQWISAFVTGSDRYTLTHPAPSNFYSMAGNLEWTTREIFNGPDGRIVTRIPLYSSRAFVHQGVMTAGDMSVTVEQWEKDAEGRLSLRLRPGADFPKNSTQLQAVVDGLVYELKLADGILILDNAEAPKSISGVFSRDALSTLRSNMAYRTWDDRKALQPKLIQLLAAQAVSAPDIFRTTIAPRPNAEDHLQLLVTAPSPESFSVQGKAFRHEIGWTLYTQDVFKP